VQYFFIKKIKRLTFLTKLKSLKIALGYCAQITTIYCNKKPKYKAMIAIVPKQSYTTVKAKSQIIMVNNLGFKQK